ncbi:MAG: hypothetical protein ACYTG7_06380 [Planctomycetota bacterium]
MKRLRFIAVPAMVLLIFTALATDRAAGEIIRLKNGKELHCEILSSSEERGVTVKRLDNGGVLELRWEHMLPADAKQIKYACGYTGEEAEAVRIWAKRVWLRNGTFEDGLACESDRPGSICIRRKGRKYYFNARQVKDIENVELEANQVYTLDELFQQKLGEAAPETPLDYFNMGVFCESITFYTKALEMYAKARELDEAYKPDVMARKIRLMEAKLEEADATALLDDIKSLIYRRKFALALGRIAEFEADFPESVQTTDKDRLKAEALKKRHAFYQQRILTDYFTYMDRLASKIAADRAAVLDGALDFTAEEMGTSIREKLAEDVYKIPLEEVEILWEDRKGGSVRAASYGTGTFILGPERAKQMPEDREDALKEEEKEEEDATTLDERLKKRIEEIRKRKSKEKSKTKSRMRLEDIGRSPEDWWRNESAANRKRFIIAFYAEESGDMKIMRVKLNPCRNCNGEGWLEQISTTGEDEKKIPCELCKTLGVERTVFFK